MIRGSLALCGLMIVAMALMTWKAAPPAGQESPPAMLFVAQIVFGSSFLLQFRARQRGNSPWMAASFATMFVGLLMMWLVGKGYL